MKNISLLLMLFLSAAPETRASVNNNVVLVTLDGVRWDEFFKGTDTSITGKPSETIFENFWKTLAKEGTTYGDERSGNAFLVSNPVNLSLPAYQNIFVGHPTFCFTNDCSGVIQETFPERIVRALKLKFGQVAGFASWERIARAFKRMGNLNVLLNAGLREYDSSDPEHMRINALQSQDVPLWPNARRDVYTFAHAKHYLITHKPRFLYISFLDSDEWGHRNDYGMYVKSLKQYDQWLLELVLLLDSMGDYGRNTTLIVTTDHGRGNTPLTWYNHGIFYPHSKKAWMYVRQAAGVEVKGPFRSHNSIRPLIESHFGL